jgi:arsenite methyltransferase
MSATLQFDEDASRRVERIYTTPDVVEQRHTILRSLALQPGERVIDIGSGPGLLACEMAVAVGPSGLVCGVDVSENMLALAKARTPPPGSAPIEYHPASAHALPWGGASFDVAVCTQVYEYVDDVPAALLELARVLRPGGRALVLDTDWDSIVWASSDEECMDRVLAAWDEHLVHPHLPRTLTRLLRDAGLEVTDRQIVPLFNAGYDPNTYSAGMLELIAKFVSDRNGVSEAEATAWAQDLTELGPSYFFSLNRYLFLAHKPRAAEQGPEAHLAEHRSNAGGH